LESPSNGCCPSKAIGFPKEGGRYSWDPLEVMTSMSYSGAVWIGNYIGFEIGQDKSR